MAQPERGPGRARLTDVARLAQVSAPTASKILNNSPGVTVREETRERVIEAANQLGYRPSAIARALAGAPTRTLALVVEDITRPMHSRTIEGVRAQGRSLGYTVLLLEDEPHGHVSLFNLLSGGQVDGVLMASARLDRSPLAELEEQAIPHVFLNRSVAGSGCNVTMKLRAASGLVIRTLADLGHTDVAHVAGPMTVDTARERELGFLDAANDYGLHSAPVEHAYFDESAGAVATARLLAKHPDLTAIYTSSVSQAAGAISALAAAGRRVPADVSVVAYGDMVLASYLQPPVDSVAMPLEEMGRLAVEAVVAQINGAASQDQEVPTPPRLIARGSVAPPPGHG